MNVADIAVKAGKVRSGNVNVPVMVSQDELTGDIIFRIPQRMADVVVHASKTEKAVPMVTFVPKYADGRTGNVSMPIVVTSRTESPDGELSEHEHVFGLRLGAFNGFVTV
jgi:hypothetical protein